MATTTESIQYVNLPLGGGIDESEAETTLPPGSLVSCQNWTPEPTGGLRVRYGWTAGPSAKASGETHTFPTTNRVRGLAYVPMKANVAWWCAGVTNGSTPELWAIRSDFTGGWWRVAGFSTPDYDAIPLAMAKGVGALIYGHPKIAKLQRWQGGTPPAPVAIDAMTRVGRALAFHKDRFWSGGEDEDSGPAYRLYYSQGFTYDSWNVSDSAVTDPGWVDIGRDDSLPVEDLASYETLLYIGKQSGVWRLSGADPTSFSLSRLEGAYCAPGRTLIPTPYGLAILGPDRAWMYRGAGPETITRAVESTYESTGTTWRMGTYCDGKLYVASFDSGAPLLVYDLVNDAWSTEKVGLGGAEPVSLAAYQNRLAMGPRAAGTNPILSYRDMPGSSRAKDVQTGASPVFSAKTGRLWLAGPATQFTLRHVYVKVRQRSGDASGTGLQVKVYVNGAQVGSTDTIAPKAGAPAIFSQRLDKFATGNDLQVELIHSVGSDAVVWDPEAVLAGIDPLPVGARA